METIGGGCGTSGFPTAWRSFTAKPNLDEVAGLAVDVDVVQLQADDLAGLGDDKRSAGQLRFGGHEGEVAVGGQHVQTPWV